MKSLLILTALIFAITLSHAQGTYPLQVGNLWQYEDLWDSTSRFSTRAVAETLMSNGQRYTVLVSDHELDTLFFRQDSSKVYNYAKYRNTDSTYWRGEELWYDFSKTLLDTVTVRYYRAVIGGVEYTDTVTITVANDGLASIFGQTRRQWEFYEKSQRFSVYAVRDVADSVGMTYYTYEPGAFSYGLKGAIINGVQYGTITGIDEIRGQFPAKYELSQNYPNPFNPTTTIAYQLPTSAYVSMKVFDLLGREVAMLVDGFENAGYKSVSFDASALPSGMYFYRINAGKFSDVKKMVLVR